MKKVISLSYDLGFRFYAVLTKKDALYIVHNYTESNVLILGKEKCLSLPKSVYLTVEDDEDYNYCLKYNIPYHTKIRSSMNRFGLHNNNMILSNSLCCGIYMHIGSFNIKDIEKDLELFSNITKKYNHKLLHIGGTHLLNYQLPYHFRVGMAIYDGAISLKACVIKKFLLKKGSHLGYNKSYIASKDTNVIILDIGYNSGLRSSVKHRVYYNGNYYKMIGNKCMDYCFVEFNDKIEIGQYVEIIGQHIKIEEIERLENKSRYELYLNLK